MTVLLTSRFGGFLRSNDQPEDPRMDRNKTVVGSHGGRFVALISPNIFHHYIGAFFHQNNFNIFISIFCPNIFHNYQETFPPKIILTFFLTYHVRQHTPKASHRI